MFTWNWPKKKKAQEVKSRIWRGSTDWTNFSKRAVSRGDTKKHAKNSKILNLIKQTVKNVEIVTFCGISKARKKRQVRNNVSLVTKNALPHLFIKDVTKPHVTVGSLKRTTLIYCTAFWVTNPPLWCQWTEGDWRFLQQTLQSNRPVAVPLLRMM